MGRNKKRQQTSYAAPVTSHEEAPLTFPPIGILHTLQPTDILVVGESFDPAFKDIVQVFERKEKIIRVPHAIGVSIFRAN